MLLYDANKSREIYPYWNFERFNLENFDNVQCLTDFLIRKNNIFRLKECLQLPENIACSQRSTYESVEGLCIFLNTLSYPYRFTNMVPLFGHNPTEICLIFNDVLHFIYQHHHHRLQSWDLNFLQPRFLQSYADAVSQKGAPLNNCFGFVDGTLISICRPSLCQRQVYNVHKRVHDIKFQSIVLPNGLIGNLVGPWEGRRHDCTMLHELGLLNDLQRVA